MIAQESFLGVGPSAFSSALEQCKVRRSGLLPTSALSCRDVGDVQKSEMVL